jgi:hypothetical protein
MLLNSIVATCQSKNSPGIKTGYYGEMLDLSFDEKKEIIYGIISISSFDNRIYCSLMFKGGRTNNTLGANKYPIVFYTQSDSVEAGHGYIEVKHDGVDVSSYDFLPACQSLLPLKGEPGCFFLFSKARPFKEASKIVNEKAYIYKSASDSSKSKMYLIKNNFISILDKVNDWVLFEYLNSKGKRIKGWLKKDDLKL